MVTTCQATQEMITAQWTADAGWRWQTNTSQEIHRNWYLAKRPRRERVPAAGAALCRPLPAALRAAGASRSGPRAPEAAGTGPACAGIGCPGSGASAPDQPAREESHLADPRALPQAGGGVAEGACPLHPTPAPGALLPPTCPAQLWERCFKPGSGFFGGDNDTNLCHPGPADLTLRPPRWPPLCC